MNFEIFKKFSKFQFSFLIFFFHFSEFCGIRNFTTLFPASIVEEKTCSPKPVVFVKTHKTGGTTITNMILRHAERNSMLVGLPIQDHWELAGYPATFDSRLIDPLAQQYQVFCHHFRFNENEIQKKVPDNSVYITIMR